MSSDSQNSYVTMLEGEILDLFKRPSVIAFICGRRGTGKTDFSLYIAETLAKYDEISTFASNIKIKESPFPIEHITSLQDLTFWLQSNSKRKLFILDEAGKALRRRTPMASLNIEILDHIQVIRHYKASLILCAPAEHYIDNASLGEDVLDLIVYKYSFENPKVGVWIDLMEKTKIDFQNIPSTTVRFDSLDIAHFTKNSPIEKPKFNDKDSQILWDWSHGINSTQLGLHSMQINRLARKFVKETLESSLTPHN